ncbi:MAG TPA: GAF domain-containing sensor histidine kinase, partial [Anaerolineales bacterium]
ELLTTFTSQATIAIENARLYTLTDQALAARVEELSVMQRIDRELNASLDIERAMRITLEWAMRQSEAEAGLLGFVEAEGVRVMASHGYTSELSPAKDAAGAFEIGNGHSSPAIHYLPGNLPGVQDAIQTGLLQRLRLNPELGEAAGGLLLGACKQMVIPLRRESDVMGVLLLESLLEENCPDDLIMFLTRLCDHAVIAITNAQLYEEVQAANLAKSKFVSFVAHELKNPMASIKGYTELVAGGMAGPVNDMQSSFLATVRSNVDRMNTIVSDLNDLTKIQVGSLRLEYKAVPVQETVNEAVRSLRRQIEEKDLVLVLNLPENLPRVWADPARLGQILTNLLSNAQKYSRQSGQITVGAEQRHGEIELNGNSDFAGLEVVHIWVQDMGIGIPVEDQNKIFRQYFRTEASKEFASGTGLGLNITKSLIEMQGGRIWFESEPGQGTTFHITIPQAE